MTTENIGRTVALPFYIFLTLLLGVLGIAAGWALWGTGGLLMLVSALYIAHAGLYWLNYSLKISPAGWWWFYYPAQTILIISIVLLMNGRSTVGLSFLGSAVICIVGEALGLWGNSRRALLLGIFYFGMMFALLYILMPRSEFYGALSGLLVNGGFIVLLMVMFNQQLIERKKAMELAESLESANARLAASAARIEMLALQNERQRMARELHDTLAQGVAGLVLQLEAVKAHLASNRTERAQMIIEQALERARSTLAESRAVIDDLRSQTTNLSSAVQEKIEHFRQSTGITCTPDITIEDNQLPVEVTTHTLAILSEALSNIARHAQASAVQISLVIHAGTLDLSIQDNGKGFDGEHSPQGHYGLIGMSERARLANGTLTIESNPGGTTINFRIGMPA